MLQPTGLTSIVLAVALSIGPAPAEPQVETAHARAERLHGEALVRFDTADYDAAILKWTEAYDALRGEPADGGIQRIIINNLAVAHARAYEVDGEVEHLRQARILAADYARNIDAIYASEPDEAAREHARIDAFVAGLDEKIAAAAPRPAAVVEPTSPRVDREPPPTPAPAPSERPGHGLVVAGATVTALGVATGVVLLAGVGMGVAANDVERDPAAREKQFARGRAGDVMAKVAAGLTPALLAAGIAMLVVGKRRARRGIAVAPWGSPRGLGLVVQGSFGP